MTTKSGPPAPRGAAPPADPRHRLLGYLEANWDSPPWSEARCELFLGVLLEVDDLELLADAVRDLLQEKHGPIIRLRVAHLREAIGHAKARRKHAKKAAHAARALEADRKARVGQQLTIGEGIQPVKKWLEKRQRRQG